MCVCVCVYVCVCVCVRTHALMRVSVSVAVPVCVRARVCVSAADSVQQQLLLEQHKQPRTKSDSQSQGIHAVALQLSIYYFNTIFSVLRVIFADVYYGSSKICCHHVSAQEHIPLRRRPPGTPAPVARNSHPVHPSHQRVKVNEKFFQWLLNGFFLSKKERSQNDSRAFPQK